MQTHMYTIHTIQTMHRTHTQLCGRRQESGEPTNSTCLLEIGSLSLSLSLLRTQPQHMEREMWTGPGARFTFERERERERVRTEGWGEGIR
jgi:hypothetical protein